MMREVAIEPLFRIFSFGKMVQYLSGKGSSLTQREVIRTKINFSALLSKDTPGQEGELERVFAPELESPLEHHVHLALSHLEHGNYTHDYKRERDFDLASACMHFIKLNKLLSLALGEKTASEALDNEKRVLPCMSFSM